MDDDKMACDKKEGRVKQVTFQEDGVSAVDKKPRKRIRALLTQIKDQMEFYFGDSNMSKDRFMKQQLDSSPDGFLPLALFLKFKKIQEVTSELDILVKAVKLSTMLELSEDENRVRRRTPVKLLTAEEVDERTVYVDGPFLPRSTDHTMIRKIFSKCGQVTYVSLPRYKTSNDIKGFAFVEFDSPEAAVRACQMWNTYHPEEEAAPEDQTLDYLKESKNLKVLKKQAASQGIDVEELQTKLKDEALSREGRKARSKKRKKKRRSVQTEADPSTKPPASTEDDKDKTARDKTESAAEADSTKSKKHKKPKKKKKRTSQGSRNPSSDAVTKGQAIVDSGVKADGANVSDASESSVRKSVSDDCQLESEVGRSGGRKRRRGDESLKVPSKLLKTASESGACAELDTAKKKKGEEGDCDADISSSGNVSLAELPVSPLKDDTKVSKSAEVECKVESGDKKKMKRDSEDGKEETEPVEKKKMKRESEQCDSKSVEKKKIKRDREEDNEKKKSDEKHRRDSEQSKKDIDCPSVPSEETQAEGKSAETETSRAVLEAHHTDPGSPDTAFQPVANGRKRKRSDSEADEDGPGKKSRGDEEGGSKKSRRKRKKQSLMMPPATMQLRVMLKKRWQELKQEYLHLQKVNMQLLKDYLKQKTHHAKPGAVTPPGPEFVPDVIIQVKSEGGMYHQAIQAEIPSSVRVAYIDVRPGLDIGHIRCADAASATQLLTTGLKGYSLEQVQGEAEREYWQKLGSQRAAKLSQNKRPKRRGKNKILQRAQNPRDDIFQGRQFYFNEDDDEETPA